MKPEYQRIYDTSPLSMKLLNDQLAYLWKEIDAAKQAIEKPTPLLDAMERNSVSPLIDNTVTRRERSLTNNDIRLKGKWGKTLDEILMVEKSEDSMSKEGMNESS